MYCSRRYRIIRLQTCLLFHGAIVELLAQSRRREPLLSSRVQDYFRGENGNGHPFAFPTEPLKIAFPGGSDVQMNRGDDT